MGEELNVLDGPIFFEKDGALHVIKFDRLSEANFNDNSKDDENIETYATLSNTDSLNFEVIATISRLGYFTLMVGPNKRTIRRAFRWYEKLRRMGYPKENLVVLASYYARKGQRSKKYELFY